MSAKLKEFGHIDSYDEIFDFLFQTKNENEMRNYFSSISGFGDLICFGCEDKLIIASLNYGIHSKNSDNIVLTINKAEVITDDYLEQSISSIVVFPIASQKQSSQGFPDWSCICVGFTSGFLKFFDQNGQLVFSQKLHDSQIDQIQLHSCPFYNNPEIFSENLMVLCGNCCYQINGHHLYESLNTFKKQLARVHAGFDDNDSDLHQLNYRKWLIESQENVTNVVFGYETRANVLDNIIMYASNKGPFASVSDQVSKYINCATVGKNPFIAFYRLPLESESLDMGDLAQAVYSKVKGAISTSLSSWLGSSKNTNKQPVKKPEVINSEIPSRLQTRHNIEESSRKAMIIIGCPQYNTYSRLAAMTDDFGRIFLIDIDEGVIIRIWKGYRDAQISISTSSSERHVNFLIIYAPRRAMIEIWTIPFGERVASFDMKDRNGKLFHVPHTLLGFSRCSKNNQKLKHCYSTFFLDNAGKLSTIEIPFHLSLVSSNNERSQDHLVLKHFKNFIKDQDTNCDLNVIKTEFLSTVRLLKLTSSVDLLIDSVVNLRFLSIEFLLSVFEELVQQINSNILALSSSEKERVRLKIHCKEILSLLNCFKMLSDLSESKEATTDEGIFQNFDNLLNLDSEDCSRIQALFTLYLQYHKTSIRQPFDHQSYHFFVNSFIPDSNNNEELVSFKLEKHVLNKDLINIGNFIFGKCVSGEHCIETVVNIVIHDTKIDKVSCFKMFLSYLIEESVEVVMINLSRIKQLLFSILGSSSGGTDYSYWNEYYKFIQNCFSISYDICEKSTNLMTSLLLSMIIRVIILELSQNLLYKDQHKLFTYLTESIVSWNDTCQRLEDLSIFSCFLKCRPTKMASKKTSKSKVSFDRDLTLAYVMENGKGIFSESFAKWAFKWNLKFVDINELYKSLGHICSDNEKEIMSPIYNLNSEIKEIFTILYKQLPHALEYDSVLINVCWEYSRLWSKNIQRIEYLQCTCELLENVGPAAGLAIQGIGRMMWDMHIKTNLELFFSNEKTEASKYSLTLILNIVETVIKFLQILLKSLENFDVIPKFSSEAVWQGEKSRSSLIDLAVAKESITVMSVELHVQLLYAFQLVMTVNLQNFNCQILYSKETRKYFFDCLTKSVPYELVQSDIAQCKNHRMRFLERIISAYTSIFSRGSEDISFCENIRETIRIIAEKWQLDLDDIRQCWIQNYYRYGLDSQGAMFLDKVSNTSLLAANLLRIVGMRIKQEYLLPKSKNYREYNKYVTPVLNKWFQNLDNVTVTATTLQSNSILIDQILEWLPENSSDFEAATCLQSLILNIENTSKYLPE